MPQTWRLIVVVRSGGFSLGGRCKPHPLSICFTQTLDHDVETFHEFRTFLGLCVSTDGVGVT